MQPDVLVLGQITVDDVVPASPGPWQRQVGGNALYAAAGARLWTPNVGVVARLSSNFPIDIRRLLADVKLSTAGLRIVDAEPLQEWILYESDGQRQSMPRNPALRDPAASSDELFRRYLTHMAAVSAGADDIPSEWNNVRTVHLAPQVLERHYASCRALHGRFVSVDPSPHYARGLTAQGLMETLLGATAFLPSQAEVQHLLDGATPEQAVADLSQAGFAEVVVKLGAAGCVWMGDKPQSCSAAPAVPVDLTGAGDSFGGAYAACRALGFAPGEAVLRASVAASLIVETSGAEAALRIHPDLARDRLEGLR